MHLSFYRLDSFLCLHREPGSEISDENPPSEVESESDASISDVDETPVVTQPYIALMQSLAKDSAPSAAPSAKRRKLDHQPQKNEAPSVVEGEKEEPSDDEGRDVDLVEEPEEEPNDEADLEDDDDDEVPDATDSFETHFVNPDKVEYDKRLKGIQSNLHPPKQQEKNGWRIMRSIPGQDPSQTSQQPTTFPDPSSLKLKHKLVEPANKLRPAFDRLEQVLYPITFGYQDLLFCGRNVNNSNNLRRMACLHAVNHIFK